MREITLTYIIAEILTGLMFICLSLTYFSKYKKQIIILNLIGSILMVIAYLLLDGINGALMDFIAAIRNIYLLLVFKPEKADSDKNILVLFFILFSIFALTIRTYNGPISILPAMGASIFTISIWQKKTIIYKILGIPSAICWLFYNMYLGSGLGVFMEIILITSSIFGICITLLKNRKYEKDTIKEYFINRKKIKQFQN